MGTALEVQDAPETTALTTPPEPMDQRTKQVMQLVGGDRARAEKMIRVAANAVKKVPALQRVDQGKMWLAILDVVSLNLTFGPRGAYLVPYGNDVTVIISPQGVIQLMYRHPLVKSVQARVVRDGEPFRIAYAPEPIVVHEPMVAGEPGPMLGAYAIIDLTTGGRVVEWMTRADIEKVKRTSKSARGGGPWQDWEEEMWRKTVLKRAAKYVPQSDDLRQAFDRDDEDADFEVVPDYGAQAALSASTGTAALKERLAAKKAAPEMKAEREPGEEG